MLVIERRSEKWWVLQLVGVCSRLLRKQPYEASYLIGFSSYISIIFLLHPSSSIKSTTQKLICHCFVDAMISLIRYSTINEWISWVSMRKFQFPNDDRDKDHRNKILFRNSFSEFQKPGIGIWPLFFTAYKAQPRLFAHPKKCRNVRYKATTWEKTLFDDLFPILTKA